MLKQYFMLKSKSSDGLKRILQLIWNQLRQDSINKAILGFTKRHRASVKDGCTFRTCFEKNCLTTLNIELTSDCPFVRRKFEKRTKVLQSCDSWSNESISVKFSRIVENSFRYKSWNFYCRQAAFCPVGHFWATGTRTLCVKNRNYTIIHVFATPTLGVCRVIKLVTELGFVGSKGNPNQNLHCKLRPNLYI